MLITEKLATAYLGSHTLEKAVLGLLATSHVAEISEQKEATPSLVPLEYRLCVQSSVECPDGLVAY